MNKIIERNHEVVGVFEQEELASLIMGLEFYGKTKSIVILPSRIVFNTIEVKNG